MTKSESMLALAIDAAAATAMRPVTHQLASAVIIGRHRLREIETNSRNCGRDWTLNKARQQAKLITRELARNNGGAA
jgi:hypothetical protein